MWGVLKKLEKANTRIKRNNARRSFFGIMKSLNDSIDKDYPIIPKPVKPKEPCEKAVYRKIDDMQNKVFGLCLRACFPKSINGVGWRLRKGLPTFSMQRKLIIIAARIAVDEGKRRISLKHKRMAVAWWNDFWRDGPMAIPDLEAAMARMAMINTYYAKRRKGEKLLNTPDGNNAIGIQGQEDGGSGQVQ